MIRLSVCANLPAGTFRLTGRDIVAVTGVVPSGQQEIASTVVAAAGRIACHQTPVEIGVEKVGEVTELHFLCQKDFSCLGRVYRRDKAKLSGKALTEFLLWEKQSPCGCHIGKVGGVSSRICVGIAFTASYRAIFSFNV